MKKLSIPNDCDLLITHDTYRKAGCTKILHFIRSKIPVLILADGILEYRNSWTQNHEVQSGIFNSI